MDWRMSSRTNVGDDNWDLTAVVKGFCSSSSSSSSSFIETATKTTTRTTRNYENSIFNSSSQENPLTCLPSIQFEEEPNPFSFQNFMFREKRNNNGGIEELMQESYMPFFATNTTITTTTTTTTTNSSCKVNTPNSSTFVINDLLLDQQDEEEEVIFDFEVDELIIDQQENQDHHQSPTQIQSRERMKTQELKRVCHVTKENLTSDEWAWRKNGRKIVKGSPFPRSYYRCSSSRGCSATKRVEQSHTDQSIYIVTYIGDHTHHPPTYSNPLARSIRFNKNKFIKGGSSTNSNSSPIAGHSHIEDEEKKNNHKETNGVTNGIHILVQEKKSKI